RSSRCSRGAPGNRRRRVRSAPPPLWPHVQSGDAWVGLLTFGRGTIVHSEAFQVANGNGCVKFSTPAHILAGCGADAAADAGKGVRLRSHLQRFIVASLGDQADV